MPRTENHAYSKSEWWPPNITWAREARLLLNPEGKFTCSFVDMSGASPWRAFRVARPYLLRDDQYVVVEYDAATWAKARLGMDREVAKNRPVPHLVFNDMYLTAKRLAVGNNPTCPPAAIFIYDTENQAGASWWGEHGVHVLDTVLAAVERSGCCVAIFNHTLESPYSPKRSQDGLLTHTQAMCALFKAWGPRVSSFLGLGSNYDKAMEHAGDRKFTGKVGAFEVYKSSRPETLDGVEVEVPNVLRMVTTRIRFEKGNRNIIIENNQNREGR